MTIETINLTGNGSFVSVQASGQLQVNTGASGTLVTITPTGSNKARLTTLFSDLSTSETNITVTIGGRTIFNNLTLTASGAGSATGHFCVGGSKVVSSTNSSASMYPPLEGDPGEAIVISKASGSLASNLQYSYEFGF